ncbi:DnaA/Hda family protein [uncultured Ferrovibrio sp.]|jgi:chromosomal replication initiation ATPase DnaA|uniref:HdaA/DnaA family protein n=1 Tax=uncultured Ferrovibrio sp. TaxID=1576913 RepID=UPI002615CC4C|nr:DnaA/Hda family protein [uncultured Ferrovibrio sp.]
MKTRQLSLGLTLPISWAREDFLVVPGNEAALGWLDRWPDWPNNALALHGNAGTGKTHLAHIWAAQVPQAQVIGADALTASTVDQLAQRPLALDDADRVGDPVALFHLVNLMRERGHSLLLTGSSPPAQWPYALPDLMSRLKAMPAQGIEEPDDALLAAVLVKLFADRQLNVGEDVVKYLVARIERSCHAARHWVAALDAAALAQGRAVTVALTRKVLEDENGF